MTEFYQILMKRKPGARQTEVLGRQTLPEAVAVARDAEAKGWVEVGVWRVDSRNISHHVARKDW